MRERGQFRSRNASFACDAAANHKSHSHTSTNLPSFFHPSISHLHVNSVCSNDDNIISVSLYLSLCLTLCIPGKRPRKLGKMLCINLCSRSCFLCFTDAESFVDSLLPASCTTLVDVLFMRMCMPCLFMHINYICAYEDLLHYIRDGSHI